MVRYDRLFGSSLRAYTLVVSSLPWLRSTAYLDAWIRDDLRARGIASPVSVEPVWRPDVESTGTRQHSGTLLVAFDTDAELHEAATIYAQLPSALQLDGRSVRFEVPVASKPAPKGATPASESPAPADTCRPSRRLDERRQHRRNRKARELERLDRLLDYLEGTIRRAPPYPEAPLAGAEVPRCEPHPIDWAAMPPSADPCFTSRKMAAGSIRGDRKRETVAAFAWLLASRLLPVLEGRCSPTIVDAGCGTGSLLLPLAHCFPNATFVGIDLKQRSLDRLIERARDGGLTMRRASTAAASGADNEIAVPAPHEEELGEPLANQAGLVGAAEPGSVADSSGIVRARVVAWEGDIAAYEGPCDALVSLHACGGECNGE